MYTYVYLYDACVFVCVCVVYARVSVCVYKFNTIVVIVNASLMHSASINRGHSDQRPGMR